ncbi:histidine kinase [Tamlana nanhaiensis]|uniref:histidine kinase n=1 Tax=Neotamlana nanhaiensis TaxID=1382798 RepID=A0A0D7W6Q8_9FLAO|nr:hybrid sensor histidine kinase/response regulator transcription factor [Tamlana nanhaiensis]KJD34734.1 histidine kinase [Tamlana nanhaiensis]
MIKQFTVIFCMVITFLGSAQNLKFQHYNSKDGLSHNSVRHIVQDEQGFLWFGTFYGLNRFDGYQFKSYLTNSNGNLNTTINNNDITVLKLDKERNTLWIGTRQGLTCLDLETRTFKTFLSQKNDPNSLPDEEIRSIYIDHFKSIWVGTKNSGLYRFYPEQNVFTKVELPGFNYIKEIFEDKKGNIWVGSYQTASVAKLSLNNQGHVTGLVKFTLDIPNTNEINPYVNFIYEDVKSDIFVGTREGIYKLNKATNSFEIIQIENKVLREKVGPYFLSIALSPEGKYWIGTLGGLLVCNQIEDLEKNEFQWHYSVLTESTSLADNLISVLYFDASGVLWIGTEDGLDKYDPYENQFHLNKDLILYTENQIPRIRGFAKTYDNKVIVATWHNGLFVSNNNSYKPLYNTKQDISSIYSVDGKVFYCGLWNGKLLVYNYEKNTSKVIDIGFKKEAISAFSTYGDHGLIVGSFGEGITFLDTQTLLPLANHERLIEDFEVNNFKKSGNVLWISAEEGIVKYNLQTKEIKIYTHDYHNKNGLPEDNLSDILVDANANVWAATRNGLLMYNAIKDVFELISEPNELSGKWITDLVQGTGDNIWLNINNNSIARFNTVSKKVNSYNITSGTRLDVFSSRGFYKVDNSQILIGGKYGIISFYPDRIKENNYAPKPFITEFKVQNKEIVPGAVVNGQVPFEKNININREVTLDYKNRNFSIQFSSPSFINERLNKFKYKLEGFDDNWIEATSASRTVQYTNLSSGNYEFKLKASNNDGVWSNEAVYSIAVLPPFWLSYKGLVLIAVILAIAFYFIRRQLQLRLKLKQELLLERVNRERDEKINNEKLTLFTNISHELRTPLTLILGPVKQLLEQKATSYERSRVSLIYQNANRLLLLVNEILDFRKAETGELKLQVSKTEILKVARKIFESFTILAETKNINFNFNAEEEVIAGWLDIDKFNKILNNLISNALKFTNNYGNVDVFIGLKEGERKMLLIEVSDDGIGVPPESKDKIFSRFYQAQNSKSITTGTGIGLSFVKALVEIHKGIIKVDSEPNQGSVFTIELPIDKNAFTKDERLSFIPKTENIETIVKNNQYTPIKELEEVKRTTTNTDIKQKILVVDDNSELRKYIVDYLSGFYKVYEAETGKQGLEICKKIKPVLCVVDVMMPEMDGFQFLEALKADENISHTAVILLTALGDNENKVKGYKIGVDDYLTKPFDPSLLKTRIDSIIKIHFDLKQKFSEEVESDIISLAHSQIDIDLISKIQELIENNINNPELNTNFLCTELAMSTSKLYRKITQLTDMPPNEFIRTLRLKKSAKLLKTKNYNVNEVADMVGFNDPFYFSRCFKKQFGYAPSSLIK